MVFTEILCDIVSNSRAQKSTTKDDIGHSKSSYENEMVKPEVSFTSLNEAIKRRLHDGKTPDFGVDENPYSNQFMFNGGKHHAVNHSLTSKDLSNTRRQLSLYRQS